MAYQLDAGNTYRQTGGYLGYVPLGEYGDRFLPAVESNVIDADFQANLAAYAASHHLDAIVMKPDTPHALLQAFLALHWPTTRDGDVTVVRVPQNGQPALTTHDR